jgi:hypothetical protein
VTYWLIGGEGCPAIDALEVWRIAYGVATDVIVNTPALYIGASSFSTSSNTNIATTNFTNPLTNPFTMSVNSAEPNPFVANAGQLKNDPTDTGFKKEFQTVGRPAVTDHNINDEYMRDAPNVRCVCRSSSSYG